MGDFNIGSLATCFLSFFFLSVSLDENGRAPLFPIYPLMICPPKNSSYERKRFEENYEIEIRIATFSPN